MQDPPPDIPSSTWWESQTKTSPWKQQQQKKLIIYKNTNKINRWLLIRNSDGNKSSRKAHFSVLKQLKHNLISTKLFSKNEGKIKTFPEKQKWKGSLLADVPKRNTEILQLKAVTLDSNSNQHNYKHTAKPSWLNVRIFKTVYLILLSHFNCLSSSIFNLSAKVIKNPQSYLSIFQT